MASTQIFAKKSLCWVSNLELSVVRAMLKRSSLNCSGSAWLSTADSFRASRATATAFFQPRMIVWGWILSSTSLSASRRSSEANTVTEVVPSPTSSSWTLDSSHRILAAGLSTPHDRRMVAPSLVTWTLEEKVVRYEWNSSLTLARHFRTGRLENRGSYPFLGGRE